MKKKVMLIIGIVVMIPIILIMFLRSKNSSTKYEVVFEKLENYAPIIDNSTDLKSIKTDTPKKTNFDETSLTEIEPSMMDVVALEKRVYFYGSPDLNSKMEKTYFVRGQIALGLGAIGEFTKIDFEYKGKHTIGYVLTKEIGSAYEYEDSEILNY